MKKCVLVNCFASSNEMRVEPIREVLNEKGYETLYISSDYHHALKKYIELDKSIIALHVRAYKKNLSIDRLLSHRDFSNEVYKFLCKELPELIYIKFPPNTLVKVAYKYKKKHDCKIILDLFDLWPESLPLPHKIVKFAKPFLKVWENYRDKYISYSDLVVTECEMYRDVLGDRLPSWTYTLYLAKKDIVYQFYPHEKGHIKLCFLGGINNLINLELLGYVIGELSKQARVSLDIIGDGKKKNELIRVAEEHGCEVIFHGIIYNEDKKFSIMSKCDFGINLVKDSVKIALSIKSVEYFRAGLAIINNVPYDTEKIINETLSGINVSMGKSIYLNEIDLLRRNSRRTYESLFAITTFKKSLDIILSNAGVI